MLTKSVLSRLTLRFVLVGSVIATLLAMGVMPVQAATAPNMGALGPCAVLAGQHIFSAGTSVVTGNLCLSPGPLTQITFPTPPNVLNGTRHAADGPALAAQASWISANGFLSAQPGATPKGKLGTGTSASIAPGIYDITGIGGAVTLQGAGVYIFRGSNLLFDAGTNMILAGGASACNVFWQDASSTTVNSTANIVGNIFAVTSIVLKSGANLRGRALAQNADVTLGSNHIGGCSGGGSSRLLSCNYNADTGLVDNRVNCNNTERVAVWCDATHIEFWGITPGGKGYSLHDFTYAELLAAGLQGVTVNLGPSGTAWMNLIPITPTYGGYFSIWSGGTVWLGNYTLAFTADGTWKNGYAKYFECPIPAPKK